MLLIPTGLLVGSWLTDSSAEVSTSADDAADSAAETEVLGAVVLAPEPPPTAVPTALPTPVPTASPTATPSPTPTVTPTPNPLAAIAAIDSPVSPDAAPIHLTFNDGPDPDYTPQLLELLAEFDAQATFFVLGTHVQEFPEITQAIVDGGHVLGNHSWAHGSPLNQSNETIATTLQSTNVAITGVTGAWPLCYRPPFGANDERTQEAVWANGYALAMWDVDSGDNILGTADEIATQVLTYVQPGDRVLFHDGGNVGTGTDRTPTIDAVRTVLEVLSAANVELTAIDYC